MIKRIVYGLGLLVIFSVIGLLGFLTLENILNHRAVYAVDNEVFQVSGLRSVFVNLGVLGLISTLIFYVVYLCKRTRRWHQCYKVTGVGSTLLICFGLFFV